MLAQSLSLIVYPSGIRHAWIQTSSCRMLIIPRAALATARAETGLDLHCPSLYILLDRLSPSDVLGPVRTYIGHAEDLLDRIAHHLSDPEKDFFRWIIAIQATDSTFDKALVQYLESWAIAVARQDPRFDLTQNKNTPSRPHLAPDRLIAATRLTSILIPLLLSTTPCPLFSTCTPTTINATASVGATASLPSDIPPPCRHTNHQNIDAPPSCHPISPSHPPSIPITFHIKIGATASCRLIKPIQIPFTSSRPPPHPTLSIPLSPISTLTFFP